MTPPRLPRAGTHNRDELVPKHPTPLAVPVVKIPDADAEEWEGDPSYTPILTPVMNEVPENESPVTTLVRRSAETKNTSLTTLAGVENLRKETREDFKEIHAKVDGAVKDIHAKVDGLAKEFKGVQIAVTEHGVQNKAILDALGDMKSERERSDQVRNTIRIAEAEVDKTLRVAEAEVDKTLRLAEAEVNKTRAITDIENDKAKKALKRELWKEFFLKVVLVVCVGAAGVLIATLNKCGG